MPSRQTSQEQPSSFGELPISVDQHRSTVAALLARTPAEDRPLLDCLGLAEKLGAVGHTFCVEGDS